MTPETIKINENTVGKLLGKVIYGEKEFPLYFADLPETNDMAAYKDQEVNAVIVSKNFFSSDVPEVSKRVFMYHELGHLIHADENEAKADIFAVKHVGKEKFSEAIDDEVAHYAKFAHPESFSAFKAYAMYRLQSVEDFDKEEGLPEYKIEIDEERKSLIEKGVENSETKES